MTPLLSISSQRKLFQSLCIFIGTKPIYNVISLLHDICNKTVNSCWYALTFKKSYKHMLTSRSRDYTLFLAVMQ